MDIQGGFLRKTQLPATQLNKDCRYPSSQRRGRVISACTSHPCRLISLSPKNGTQISWVGLAALLDLITVSVVMSTGVPSAGPSSMCANLGNNSF